MKHLTSNLSININISATAPLSRKVFEKFERLSNITKISIAGEIQSCDKEKAYSQVSAPWVPVKCYYRLYYLESTFLYLLKNSNVGFGSSGHTEIRKSLRNFIRNRDISLAGTGASKLSRSIQWDSAQKFRTVSGSTLRADYHKSDECTNSLQKKLSDYIEIDWKLKERIKNYRTKIDREKKINELLIKEFNLIDYFYWMRIKANYRDVDFLDFDKDVNENDAYEYLMLYIETAEQYATALQTAIDTLKRTRSLV